MHDTELNSLPFFGDFLQNLPSEKMHNGCGMDRISNQTQDNRFIKLKEMNVTEQAL